MPTHHIWLDLEIMLIIVGSFQRCTSRPFTYNEESGEVQTTEDTVKLLLQQNICASEYERIKTSIHFSYFKDESKGQLLFLQDHNCEMLNVLVDEGSAAKNWFRAWKSTPVVSTALFEGTSRLRPRYVTADATRHDLTPCHGQTLRKAKHNLLSFKQMERPLSVLVIVNLIAWFPEFGIYTRLTAILTRPSQPPTTVLDFLSLL